MSSKRKIKWGKKSEKKKNVEKKKQQQQGEERKQKVKVKTAVSLLDPKTLFLLRRPKFHADDPLTYKNSSLSLIQAR